MAEADSPSEPVPRDDEQQTASAMLTVRGDNYSFQHGDSNVLVHTTGSQALATVPQVEVVTGADGERSGPQLHQTVNLEGHAETVQSHSSGTNILHQHTFKPTDVGRDNPIPQSMRQSPSVAEYRTGSPAETRASVRSGDDCPSIQPDGASIEEDTYTKTAYAEDHRIRELKDVSLQQPLSDSRGLEQDGGEESGSWSATGQATATLQAVGGEGLPIHWMVNTDRGVVQLGQRCCVVANMDLSDARIAQLREEGCLTTEVQSPGVLVRIQWSDWSERSRLFKSKIKLKIQTAVASKLEDIERAILNELFTEMDHYSKLRKTVQNCFHKYGGMMQEIISGCVEFIFLHKTDKSPLFTRPREAEMDLRKFFDQLLRTEAVIAAAAGAEFSLVVQVLEAELASEAELQRFKPLSKVYRTEEEVGQASREPARVRRHTESFPSLTEIKAAMSEVMTEEVDKRLAPVLSQQEEQGTKLEFLSRNLNTVFERVRQDLASNYLALEKKILQQATLTRNDVTRILRKSLRDDLQVLGDRFNREIQPLVMAVTGRPLPEFVLEEEVSRLAKSYPKEGDIHQAEAGSGGPRIEASGGEQQEPPGPSMPPRPYPPLHPEVSISSDTSDMSPSSPLAQGEEPLTGNLEDKYLNSVDFFYDINKDESIDLPLGTRVGPMSEAATVDSGNMSVGTVVQHGGHDNPGVVVVKWDNQARFYKYREGEVFRSERQSPCTIHDDVDIGVFVTKGPDWKHEAYAGQDGPHQIGTVIRVNRKEGLVQVKWKAGSCNAYRFGSEGPKEIRITPESFSELSTGLSSQASGYQSSTLRLLRTDRFSGYT